MEPSAGGSGAWATASAMQIAVIAMPHSQPVIAAHRRKEHPVITLQNTLRFPRSRSPEL
jgi:hypothetical protein